MPDQRLLKEPSIPRRIPVRGADWPWLLCGAILAAGAIAAYSRSFSVPRLFDDDSAIVDNQTLRHWSTAFCPPPNTTTSGRPILNLSLAINYAISGTAVWSYHALNLAIHVLAGLTLFGIVRRTLERLAVQAATLVGFAAALFWTLHPLQTESVTYIVQRAESLMGLFYLLTVYCFIRAVGADSSRPQAGRAASEGESRTGLSRGHLQDAGNSADLSNAAPASQPASDTGSRCPARVWFGLCVAACLLGMATKEVMVSAPLIVLLYDRTFVAGSFRDAWLRRRGLHLALAATWLLLIGLVASTGWDRSGTSGFDVGITPLAYWLTQFEAITRYLWLSVWPHPLVFEYGAIWVNRLTTVTPHALVVVALAVMVLVALWRRPVLGFLGAWFFAILAPTSIMPGRIQMIVEHRMYLPLAAVVALVAFGIHAAFRRWSWMAFAAIALVLGVLTARRNEDYRSKLALWSDTVAKRPNNERAYYNLGNVWSEIPGRLGDAIAQYREALRLRPDYAQAHNNLGVALARIPGRLNDAIAEYGAAIRVLPDFAEAHNNLGNAWSKIPGRLNEAVAEYEAAIRVLPDFAQAHNNLADALARIPGRLNEAIAEYETALRLKPDYVQAHNNLGVAFAQMPGRLNDAIAQYEAVLRLKPDSAEAHNNLGLALARDPLRLNDAVAQYREALRLQPDYAPGWHNLGACWFHLGNRSEAAAAFREELRLSPNDPAAQKALETVLQQSEDR